MVDLEKKIEVNQSFEEETYLQLNEESSRLCINILAKLKVINLFSLVVSCIYLFFSFIALFVLSDSIENGINELHVFLFFIFLFFVVVLWKLHNGYRDASDALMKKNNDALIPSLKSIKTVVTIFWVLTIVSTALIVFSILSMFLFTPRY